MRQVGSNRGRGRSVVLRAAGRWQGVLVAVLLLPVLLTACGDEEEPATSTAAPAATTTSSDQAPGGGTGSPAAASAVASPSGALTLGELAGRIDAAWGGVSSFRSVFLIENASAAASPTASPIASPGAAAGQTEIVREVILPDRQHQIERVNGAVVSEAIVIGNRAYLRGAEARTLQPEIDDTTWVAIDLAGFGSMAGNDPLLARLAAPVESPAANIPDNLRPQELRPLGPVEVGDRTCQAYAAAATTELGNRIDLTIAVDDADLPCFVESRSGAAGGRETFEAYNLPLTIDAPATTVAAASPVGTPAGQD